MFTLNNLWGKRFVASLAAVELDSFILFLAPTTLDHFSALAVRAVISCCVRRLAAVAPKQIEVPAGLQFFCGGFFMHRFDL
jgi:hypothetical protein